MVPEKAKYEGVSATRPEPLLTRDEFIAMAGLVLVALGLVFVFGEADILDYGSPWWTLFIGIPGLVFLVASVITVNHQGRITPMAVVQFVIGMLAVLLALSFILDPTWSFTHNWTLFRNGIFNTIWQWGLVVLGVVLIFSGLTSHSFASVFFGVLVGLVGLVFVLGISWNAVWPFAIVAVGVAVLSLLFRRRSQN